MHGTRNTQVQASILMGQCFKKSNGHSITTDSDFKRFTASNDRLEKLKLSCGIRETLINGEDYDIPQINAKSWIDCLSELNDRYDLKDQWNMDELGTFFSKKKKKQGEASRKEFFRHG